MEGLSHCTNIHAKEDDDTGDWLWDGAIKTIYQELYGETIEETKEIQRRNRHNNRNVLGERLPIRFEINRKARELPTRSLIQIDYLTNTLEPLACRLYFKYQIFRPLIRRLLDCKDTILEQLKSATRSMLFWSFYKLNLIFFEKEWTPKSRVLWMSQFDSRLDRVCLWIKSKFLILFSICTKC